MKIARIIGLLGLALIASLADAAQWTYRDMLTARKACSEYYFAMYTNWKDSGRAPEWVTPESIYSFYAVARQSSADMVEFAAILDDVYDKPTYEAGGAVASLPYRTGLEIPFFGLDFEFPIPGYSVVPPRDVVNAYDKVVTLYAYNRFKSMWVTPDHTYVYGLPMRRTLEDCKLTGWYPTPAEARAAGEPPMIGVSLDAIKDNLLPAPRIWTCRGTVNADGTIKLDSWIVLKD